MGDFNRHDQLWGGDQISPVRQGEADALVDYMTEHSLHSLLLRGTKTWYSGDTETTIDLVLASTELAEEMVKCGIHYTNYGSDHQAIETEFDISVPDRPTTERLLWKNAPWTEIRARVTTSLQGVPLDGSVQLQTDRLMIAVTEAVSKLTPKAKPSPYAKRWWTTDLTQLRCIYTYWRNQARSRRRAGCIIHELEQQAHKAAKEYHDAIRKQKKIHWEDFLANDANIWQATKYLKPNSSSFSDKIPPLVKADGSTTKDKGEQMKELLATFFPPLPTRIEDEGTRPQREPIHMPDLTMEEIERKVFEAKPWKAPGEDGLPAMVWRQLWPVVKERVFRIFQISLQDSDLPSQWRNAKIIPLKKPAKKNYALAKAWRLISLLSTLGKILEAVVAERISYAVEEFGLLPINHFGARKRRSAEQALLLLLALAERQLEWTLPENVGKYSKAIDAALPGKHTRSLYDRLNRKEAKILAQLRTGMTGLNSYLNRIGAADSDLCACGQASETVEHFLFRCTKWTAMREGMNQCTESRRGNLSFFLGGKSRSDPDRWQPDMKAVQAVIKYAIATGRLEQEPEAGPPST
ncbi:hypothetical protein TMatcc_006696 [Talaromyces marneffei ATCC 18224]